MTAVPVSSKIRSLSTSRHLRSGIVVALHLAALWNLWQTEVEPFNQALFVLTWALLNFAFLMLLRRPALSAALALALVQIVIVLSEFKFSILWMTINFFDILIIDPDTFAFLFRIFPSLRTTLIVVSVLAIPAVALLWRLDPFRIDRRLAAVGVLVCFASIVGLSLWKPERPWEPFQGVNHVSGFARSGVVSVAGLLTHGWLESDATATDRLRAADPCRPAGKLPNIVLVLDEASFDISEVPGIKVPDSYRRHFQSFDGQMRSFLVEGSGGPTWYTEYNVLTGLSARSFGRFMYYVTRLAAGRVERGLPQALRRCGYKTFTLYPAYGSFLSARRFQQSTGVQRLLDSKDMGMGDVEPDSFFYDQAARLIGRERGGAPLFVFAYTVANHFPWDVTYRPDLTPDWQPPGNAAEVDEYIRRQAMSARDYQAFLARLKRDFPGEPFLIVRFGDHQPALAARIVDPTLAPTAIAQRIMANDPRYYTTYYAIDAINFTPSDLSAARDPLDAAYLPLVIQEAAGVPLDPTFVEQKKIFERCRGLFYLCSGGAEARRFNRLLIDAGLIKGMLSR